MREAGFAFAKIQLRLLNTAYECTTVAPVERTLATAVALGSFWATSLSLSNNILIRFCCQVLLRMCKPALLCLISVTVFNISHYTPSCTLHSASDTLSLQIPHTKLSTVGSCAFSVFGPSTWNGLALPLHQKPWPLWTHSNLRENGGFANQSFVIYYHFFCPQHSDSTTEMIKLSRQGLQVLKLNIKLL